MKLWIIFALVCSVLADQNEEEVNQVSTELLVQNALNVYLQKFTYNLPKTFIEKLTAEAEAQALVEFANASLAAGTQSDGQSSAIINEWVDRLFENLQTYIDTKISDTVSLPDTTVKLKPTGKSTLTEGSLTGIASIQREYDTTVTYDSSSKKFKITVGIRFDRIRLQYRYYTKVLFVKIRGGLVGKIKNAIVYTELSFDLNKYQIVLDDFNLKESGSLSIKFNGNKGIDWLTNAMSSAFTYVLHPVVIKIVQKSFKKILNTLIESLNLTISSVITVS